MIATSSTTHSGAIATSPRLQFDEVINPRAAEILKIPVEEVKDHHIADLVGVSRETVSRWRNGHMQPTLTMTFHIAAVFSVSVQALTGQAEHASRA